MKNKSSNSLDSSVSSADQTKTTKYDGGAKKRIQAQTSLTSLLVLRTNGYPRSHVRYYITTESMQNG